MRKYNIPQGNGNKARNISKLKKKSKLVFSESQEIIARSYEPWGNGYVLGNENPLAN